MNKLRINIVIYSIKIILIVLSLTLSNSYYLNRNIIQENTNIVAYTSDNNIVNNNIKIYFNLNDFQYFSNYLQTNTSTTNNSITSLNNILNDVTNKSMEFRLYYNISNTNTTIYNTTNLSFTASDFKLFEYNEINTLTNNIEIKDIFISKEYYSNIINEVSYNYISIKFNLSKIPESIIFLINNIKNFNINKSDFVYIKYQLLLNNNNELIPLCYRNNNNVINKLYNNNTEDNLDHIETSVLNINPNKGYSANIELKEFEPNNKGTYMFNYNTKLPNISNLSLKVNFPYLNSISKSFNNINNNNDNNNNNNNTERIKFLNNNDTLILNKYYGMNDTTEMIVNTEDNSILFNNLSDTSGAISFKLSNLMLLPIDSTYYFYNCKFEIIKLFDDYNNITNNKAYEIIEYIDNVNMNGAYSNEINQFTYIALDTNVKNELSKGKINVAVNGFIADNSILEIDFPYNKYDINLNFDIINYLKDVYINILEDNIYGHINSNKEFEYKNEYLYQKNIITYNKLDFEVKDNQKLIVYLKNKYVSNNFNNVISIVLNNVKNPNSTFETVSFKCSIYSPYYNNSLNNFKLANNNIYNSFSAINYKDINKSNNLIKTYNLYSSFFFKAVNNNLVSKSFESIDIKSSSNFQVKKVSNYIIKLKVSVNTPIRSYFEINFPKEINFIMLDTEYYANNYCGFIVKNSFNEIDIIGNNNYGFKCNITPYSRRISIIVNNYSLEKGDYLYISVNNLLNNSYSVYSSYFAFYSFSANGDLIEKNEDTIQLFFTPGLITLSEISRSNDICLTNTSLNLSFSNDSKLLNSDIIKIVFPNELSQKVDIIKTSLKEIKVYNRKLEINNIDSNSNNIEVKYTKESDSLIKTLKSNIDFTIEIIQEGLTKRNSYYITLNSLEKDDEIIPSNSYIEIQILEGIVNPRSFKETQKFEISTMNNIRKIIDSNNTNNEKVSNNLVNNNFYKELDQESRNVINSYSNYKFNIYQELTIKNNKPAIIPVLEVFNNKYSTFYNKEDLIYKFSIISSIGISSHDFIYIFIPNNIFYFLNEYNIKAMLNYNNDNNIVLPISVIKLTQYENEINNYSYILIIGNLPDYKASNFSYEEFLSLTSLKDYTNNKQSDTSNYKNGIINITISGIPNPISMKTTNNFKVEVYNDDKYLIASSVFENSNNSNKSITMSEVVLLDKSLVSYSDYSKTNSLSFEFGSLYLNDLNEYYNYNNKIFSRSIYVELLYPDDFEIEEYKDAINNFDNNNMNERFNKYFNRKLFTMDCLIFNSNENNENNNNNIYDYYNCYLDTNKKAVIFELNNNLKLKNILDKNSLNNNYNAANNYIIYNIIIKNIKPKLNSINESTDNDLNNEYVNFITKPFRVQVFMLTVDSTDDNNIIADYSLMLNDNRDNDDLKFNFGCDDSCASCTTTNVSNNKDIKNKQCLSCYMNKNNRYLFNNECLTECPIYTSYNTNLNICEKCSNNCLTCADNNINFCLSCNLSLINPNQILLKSTGECLSECPLEYYSSIDDNGNKTCEKCNYSCSICSSYNSCVKCKDDINYVLYKEECLENCPEGTIKQKKISDNVEDNRYKCSPCTNNCKTCYERTDFCTSCSNGLILYNNECKLVCPKGTVFNGETCIDCPVGCSECNLLIDSNKFICNSCNIDYILIDNSICKIKQKECLNINEFLNENNFQCEECDTSCLNCIDNKFNCTKCTLDKSLNNGKCVSSCEASYVSEFADDLDTNLCNKCQDNNCLICKSSINSNCQKCKEGLILYKGECILQCPLGSYYGPESNDLILNNYYDYIEYEFNSNSTENNNLNNTIYQYGLNMNFSCHLCPKNCESCYITDTELRCLTCKESMYITPNKRCADTCPEGYIKNNYTKYCDEYISIIDETTNKEDNYTNKMLKQEKEIVYVYLNNTVYNNTPNNSFTKDNIDFYHLKDDKIIGKINNMFVIYNHKYKPHNSYFIILIILVFILLILSVLKLRFPYISLVNTSLLATGILQSIQLVLIFEYIYNNIFVEAFILFTIVLFLTKFLINFSFILCEIFYIRKDIYYKIIFNKEKSNEMLNKNEFDIVQGYALKAKAYIVIALSFFDYKFFYIYLFNLKFIGNKLFSIYFKNIKLLNKPLVIANIIELLTFQILLFVSQIYYLSNYPFYAFKPELWSLVLESLIINSIYLLIKLSSFIFLEKESRNFYSQSVKTINLKTISSKQLSNNNLSNINYDNNEYKKVNDISKTNIEDKSTNQAVELKQSNIDIANSYINNNNNNNYKSPYFKNAYNNSNSKNNNNNFATSAIDKLKNKFINIKDFKGNNSNNNINKSNPPPTSSRHLNNVTDFHNDYNYNYVKDNDDYYDKNTFESNSSSIDSSDVNNNRNNSNSYNIEKNKNNSNINNKKLKLPNNNNFGNSLNNDIEVSTKLPYKTKNNDSKYSNNEESISFGEHKN